MKSLKLILVVFALCLPVTSFSATWTAWDEVDNLYVHSSYDGVFVRVGPVLNPDGCTNPDWFFVPSSNIRFKEIYSMLLAARSSKQPVKVYISGCAANRPQLQHVQM